MGNPTSKRQQQQDQQNQRQQRQQKHEIRILPGYVIIATDKKTFLICLNFFLFSILFKLDSLLTTKKS